MPRISDERKEATRRRLIDAAVEVTMTKGAAATTREILAAAGLSAGALYHYFESKDQLYQAIAQRFVDVDAATERLDPDASVADAIEHHSAVVSDMFAEGGHTILAQLRAASLESEPVRSTLGHLDQRIVEVSAENHRITRSLGLFSAEIDPAVLVELIVVFWEGFIMREATSGFATDRQEVAEAFLEMLASLVVVDDHPEADEFRRRLRSSLQPTDAAQPMNGTEQ